ncbi:uncharacterized protein LOC126475138 isoform X4 [Schistocerca serialis cubense]|uniref:uncharacterized protein LOC126475138 isoform X4 n=1 Tax=Schistocerca serialis cubense TaxID=2023355 RepID=UPI00214EAA81|nr:uncharacterized protein LOC126475138 isoform X4 [Schistocerca serialis cubense]
MAAGRSLCFGRQLIRCSCQVRCSVACGNVFVRHKSCINQGKIITFFPDDISNQDYRPFFSFTGLSDKKKEYSGRKLVGRRRLPGLLGWLRWLLKLGNGMWRDLGGKSTVDGFRATSVASGVLPPQAVGPH